jgi:hypothetical protein
MFVGCRFTMTANEKVLWLVGALKLVRPNVFRHKLLMLNYLQMFGSFRPPKQKYKRITKVQLFPSAPTCHNTMLFYGCTQRKSIVEVGEFENVSPERPPI